MKKLTLFLVAMLAMVNVANAQRAWAYDLELTPSVDSYTFAFKAVTAGDATLVFYKEGVEAGTLNLGSVSAGDNTVTKTSEELLAAIQQSGDFTWGVKMSAGAIALSGTYLTELTAAGQGLDFYLPQGLVVDNNPESETFSTLFIAEAQGGTLSVGPTHKQGIYHYSQKLAELNPTDQGIIPSNVTLTNGSRQEMHRIAINPKNNHVAFAHNISGKPAVWSVPANNPAGEATNLIAGTAITMPNSICFDENGALYVMDNANATTGGTLYKVVDGVATKLVQNKTWQQVDNSLAYDGRGGIWIAQTSTGTTWPSYAILSHVNSSGEIDWSALDHSSEGLFSAGNSYGYSQRGQCAYNTKEDLLVLGGNCRSHIFQVTYNAAGVPSLTLKYRTPYIKASTNIDGAAFDYAGDLYLMSASRERLYKYVVPTNSNTCTVPAKKSQVITLVSTTPEHTVTISVNGNGTVTGANTGTYLEGTELTLTPTPAEHYEFTGWTGDVSSTDNPLTVTVNSDMTITANFQEHAKYTITAVPNDENMGTVTGGREYYVGESATLKATAKSGYVFAGWADGEKNATRTVIVSGNATYTANFQAIAPRAWAYDLKVAEDGDNYKFTFNTTAAGTATLLFADIDGNPVAPTSHDVGPVAVGANTVLVAKASFTENKDVYWSVKMDGEAIPAISEITDQSRGIYDFYNMMGVVVDNDTESEDFGKIYIQQSFEYTSGTTADRNKTQKAGIFIYDQGLNELNPTNVGYKPTMPTGYTAIGASRESFKRLAINPTNGNLVFGNNISGEGSVWSIGRDNLTAEATNIIEGATGIDKVNAICYDENGSLYVLANITTGSAKYNLYKFTDGEQTELTLGGAKVFVDADVAMTSDGRGGLWIAQRRGGITQYSILSHVNVVEDKVDFVLDAEGTYKDWFAGNCFRAAIAYNAAESIVAVQGASKILLFKVSYDALTGAPSISKYLQVSPVGSSVDGLAFDYAGDLYTVNSGSEKFQKFTIPTDDNICTVPAPSSQKLVLGTQCEVTVTVNDPAMGSVEGAGQYEKGAEVTLTPNPVAHHRFVNWTGDKTSTDNPLKFTIEGDVNLTANFEAIPTYTITTSVNDSDMGTVTAGGTYYEDTEVTLTATANAGYVFVQWSDGNTNETRTFTAGVDMPETLTANFKVAVPRAWAYDLRLDADTDPANYIFTFNTTSAGTATLNFKYKEGTIFYTHSADVATGKTTIKIAKSTFDAATKDIYWEVELAGEAIAKMAELTDPTEGIYNFYVPQGVAVDNSPNSMYFGRIYVAEGTTGANDGGSEMAKQMTAGLFVYNQALEKVQPATGYTGIIPQNVTFNTNKPTSTDEINIIRQQMHRVAVDPVTGEVAFAYYKSPATAIYSMNPDDLAGNAQNLIEGSSITYANSLCFDSEGTLYVMNNANTGLTGGQIYKVQDGEVTLFAAHDKNNQWAVYDNAMASDGRGGLWIAQNRYAYDYPILSHVNKEGEVDFAVKENLNGWFPNNNTGSSYRGQLAYNEQEDILAFAGNKMVTLFTVEYDGNGKPTINKLMSTPLLGGNIDGVAFDYAGDLYAASASSERLYKFVIPTNTNTCTVPAPKSQAIEKEQKYTVTVVASPAEGGSVSGGGEAAAGAQVTVSATANTGYRFVNWTKGSDEVSTDASFSYTVPAEDVTLIANFEKISYTLTVFVNDETKGTIDVTTGSYEYGSEVTLTATPNPGYKLLAWSNKAKTSSITITMDNNKAVSAYFVKDYDVEPTISVTQIWKNTDVPVSTNNGYQAVGWGGKFYLKDRLNRTIWEYSSESVKEVYTLTDDFTSESALKGDQSIAVDNAGNLIVRSGSGEFHTSPVQVTIYRNGEKTGKTVDFTLPVTERCDFITASGDIFSEKGGYIYFLCKDQKTVSRLFIKNGAITAEDVAVDAVATIPTAASSQSNVVLDIYGNIHTQSKNAGAYEYNITTLAATADPYLGAATKKNPNSTIGGCTFELGGKELWAYAAGTTNYSSEWELSDANGGLVSDGVLCINDLTTVKNNTAANWLNVQVVDENTAYIYQFCPTVGVAMWKVSIEAPKYTRTVTNGDYGTICLPYGSSNYNGAEFYEIAYLELEADGTTPKGIWLDEVTELEAGKPYIFKATADELVVYYEGEEALSPVEGKAGLTGTFEGISDPNDILEGNYMIANNKFWLCGTGCWLNANRAYIKHDALHASTTPVSPMPGRRRVYMGGAGENSATGTENMIVPNQQVQKVIENGQLIIIRDGVKYNVQGVRL